MLVGYHPLPPCILHAGIIYHAVQRDRRPRSSLSTKAFTAQISCAMRWWPSKLGYQRGTLQRNSTFHTLHELEAIPGRLKKALQVMRPSNTSQVIQGLLEMHFLPRKEVLLISPVSFRRKLLKAEREFFVYPCWRISLAGGRLKHAQFAWSTRRCPSCFFPRLKD